MLQLLFSVAFATLLIVAIIAVVQFREMEKSKYPDNKAADHPHVARPKVR